MDTARASENTARTELDRRICERACSARDPRFDGRFFVGVRTTGIYCRPICPVPQPRAENATYFRSAAAAAAAGFRPCLRCRPESSPGTSAWRGTSATVARALRLVADGALDAGGVGSLADSLGIGSRHLSRLFLQHLGASPLSVARTRRLHFAKTLLDQTTLSMTEIAAAAGFGSVRRFNAVIRAVYGRTPTELRRRDTRRARRDDACRLRLEFRPPLNWPALIGFLRPRATPGVEQVDGGTYRRTIEIDGRAGLLAVSPVRTANAISLELRGVDPSALLRVVERVRRMFDLHADPGAIDAQLRRDPRLAALVAARPGVRVPGCWDGFELAVRAILGQQVTVKGATTLAGRLVRTFGRRVKIADDGPTRLFPDPAALAEADLTGIGLPARRAAAVSALAHATAESRVVFDGSVEAATLASQLSSIPGIGDWTAQYVTMRAQGDPDAFPETDLGLLRALDCTPRELRARARRWRPWRAYAAMHLWSRTGDE